MVETSRKVAVAIGSGAPASGTLEKGWIALALNGNSDDFVDIYTSTDGSNIVRLKVPSQGAFDSLVATVNAQAADDHLTSGNFDNSTNTLTLTTSDGNTTSIVIPDDKVLLVNDLTTGGSDKAATAEMAKQLKGMVDEKVSKVSGSSLIPTSKIAKLDDIEANADVSEKADWNATSGKAEILNKPNIITYNILEY